MTTAAPVEFHVLGPLEIVVGGSAVPLTADKQRLLLAALLIRAGEALPADALIDALWEGTPPASARKALHIYVSQLRGLLPAGVRIETRGSAYVLVLNSVTVDAHRFESLFGRARTALADGNPALARSLFTRALSLWRGPAYAELAYADVTRAEADRLEELRLAAEAGRLEAQLELGEGDVVASARKLVAEHPHDERVARLAMLALYRADRQAEALEEYAAARARLDTLGLEPGRELRELQRAILVHEPSLQPTVPRSAQAPPLPAAPNALVGRERELAELADLLAREDVRFVVLTGAGGSGKTRLALEAARNAAPSFANGAALVPLAPVRDPALVVPAIVSALGVREEAGEIAWDALVRTVRPQEILLLVDNVEHVRDGATALVDLLAAAPLVTVLATSRTVLHLTGEYVVPVDPLDVQDAVDLFERRAREAGSRLPLYESAGVVRAICARVDALPLAVELAARQIRSLSPQELLKTLDERLPLLAGGPRDLPARQQTLAATLAWSFDLLGEHEREALERLAAFPGGCTAEAAEEICGAGVDTLAALVEHSLLNRIDGEAGTRFTMLETVREFALSQLGDDRPEVERRQAEWALALAERAELRGPDQGEWLARLYAEEGNLRGALFWSGVHEAELQVRLASALRRFWWIRGELAEGRRWLEAALAQDVSDPALRANALAAIAGICWSHGDLAAARRYATEAVAKARAGGEAFHEASANTVLGLVAKHEQRFDDARRHFERSIALADEHDLETDVFVGKLNLATVELDAGRLDRAEGLLEEVLAFHEAGDSLEGVGFVLLNLGLVSFRAGDTTQAQERFAGALDAFEHIDFREHLANALHGLAVVAAAEERYEEAARLFGRADPILRDVGAASFEPELVAEARVLLEDELGPERFGELLVDARD